MDGGHDDMGRGFVVELDDEFAQIGFQGLDAVFLQVGIEFHLIRFCVKVRTSGIGRSRSAGSSPSALFLMEFPSALSCSVSVASEKMVFRLSTRVFMAD